LAEWQGKLRAKKEANEARVSQMREGTDKHEYQKGNAIALHEARVKNMDSQIA
jgi:chemotaxis regulatin CheY-phosphate phosphatase CheZ